VRVAVLWPVVLWSLGLATIVLAVRSGGASFGLLLIFPVVHGGSPWLALGSLLIFAGFVALGFVGSGGRAPGDTRPASSAGSPAADATPTTGGGVVLVGPIPILFGSWKGDPTAYRRWAILGLVLTAVAVLAVFWLA